jgi:hypothetical protein
MSWIQTAYLIAEVIAIPLTGLLSRALSGRRLFLGALTLFTLASIGCAFSPDFNTLIFFRILQDLFGDYFDSHVPFQVELMRPEDFSHTAFADAFNQNPLVVDHAARIKEAFFGFIYS